MNSDLTFITNEENRNLLERFKVLIQDTRFFDVLVGYFYTSGFHAIYKSLENTEKDQDSYWYKHKQTDNRTHSKSKKQLPTITSLFSRRSKRTIRTICHGRNRKFGGSFQC
ncbi:hypothetical protein BAC3_00112 [uncultured bacterium]|nr:hypothetical protein BAC3_00112 [uncultured bacterium]